MSTVDIPMFMVEQQEFNRVMEHREMKLDKECMKTKADAIRLIVGTISFVSLAAIMLWAVI